MRVETSFVVVRFSAMRRRSSFGRLRSGIAIVICALNNTQQKNLSIPWETPNKREKGFFSSFQEQEKLSRGHEGRFHISRPEG